MEQAEKEKWRNNEMNIKPALWRRSSEPFWDDERISKFHTPAKQGDCALFAFFHTVLVPALLFIITNVVGTEIKLIKAKPSCFPEAIDNIIEFDH